MKLIAEMDAGEHGYVVPWAFYPSKYPFSDTTLLFVRGDYTVHRDAGGTAEIHILMNDKGIVELLSPLETIKEYLGHDAPLNVDWKWRQVRPVTE